jgi:D-alanyl-lipoteichoic acid acyltransferase DltB (MBOAT superfamily)
MSWNAKYGLLIFASTAVTYLCALLIGRANSHADEKKAIPLKRFILIVSIVINIGLLAFFKYTGFFMDNINAVLEKTGLSLSIPKFDIVLPIGISFFIFQAVGYTIDVYRGEMLPEKNPFRYALFVSFFPQLVAGPIERSKNLLMQLKEERSFDADNAREGLLTMAFGIFMKMVVADNISTVIDPVYASPGGYSGMAVLFAAVLFSFQIYCDFGGYTLIAIGSARVLGIKLNPNFNAPYMGLSIGDFWKRWHISLTSWFRDYLYIPLGGNRKGKARKYLNTGIVFILSGLWHGAAWHYVAWGLLNGVLCIGEDILKPLKNKLDTKLHIRTDDSVYKGIMRFLTFMLVTLTWIFFRAPSLGRALDMVGMIVKDFRPAWFIRFEFTKFFEDPAVMLTVLVPIMIVMIFDMFKYKGKEAAQLILERQAVIRWIIYICIVLLILYWGFYGKLYGQTQFIYFQF